MSEIKKALKGLKEVLYWDQNLCEFLYENALSEAKECVERNKREKTLSEVKRGTIIVETFVGFSILRRTLVVTQV